MNESDSLEFGEVTALLRQISAGMPDARDRLLQLMYPELKRLAVAQMARERKGHTLQPTDLVNEAFLRLPSGELSVKDRYHFLAIVAKVMRRVLVDHARARLSRKRGSGKQELLSDKLGYDPRRPEDLMDLDRALTQLEEMNPRQARVVEMRFFGGLTEEQIASVLQVSSRTVKRDWEIARGWLSWELSGGRPTE